MIPLYIPIYSCIRSVAWGWHRKRYLAVTFDTYLPPPTSNSNPFSTSISTSTIRFPKCPSAAVYPLTVNRASTHTSRLPLVTDTSCPTCRICSKADKFLAKHRRATEFNCARCGCRGADQNHNVYDQTCNEFRWGKCSSDARLLVQFHPRCDHFNSTIHPADHRIRYLATSTTACSSVPVPG